MKATGIVRRIDELGRVVIPKEIRRTQRIRRGDPLEIFTTGDGEVIFKKYSPIGELQGVAMQYAEVLSKCFALTAFVADRDRMMAVAGAGRRDLADRSISQPLEKADGEPQALPAAGRGADGAPLRGFAPGAAVRVPHHRGGRRGRGRGPADRGPERQTGRLPAESRGRCGRFSGKTNGRMKGKKRGLCWTRALFACVVITNL